MEKKKTLKRSREKENQELRVVHPSPTKESILAQTCPFVRLTKDSDFNGHGMTKIITWNVNGLRATLKCEENFHALFEEENPDIVCLQETKLSRHVEDLSLLGYIKGYVHYDCISAKNGYSGTRMYVRESINHEVIARSLQFSAGHKNNIIQDDEGRVIIIEFDSIVIINTYVPNAGDGLKRVDYRVSEWDEKMCECIDQIQKYLQKGGKKKEVIWTGDLNVAERDFDRYFQKSYEDMGKVAGFSPMERSSFRNILQRNNMVDSFRELYPRSAPVYSFWSYRIQGRKFNLGWRLDYFVVQKSLMDLVKDTFMLSHITGSDHCPCVLWLNKRL